MCFCADTNFTNWCQEATSEWHQSMEERVGQLFLAVQHAEMGHTHYCGWPTSKNWQIGENGARWTTFSIYTCKMRLAWYMQKTSVSCNAQSYWPKHQTFIAWLNTKHLHYFRLKNFELWWFNMPRDRGTFNNPSGVHRSIKINIQNKQFLKQIV